MSSRPLVCIDARLIPGAFGGVEQVVRGLAAGLRSLGPTDFDLAFLTLRGSSDWLRPLVPDGARIVECAPDKIRARALAHVAIALLPERTWTWLADRMQWHLPRAPHELTNLRPDLIHFTMQHAFVTEVRNLYHPHDLQHEHLPHLFPRRIHAFRTLRYRALARRATRVVVATAWTRQDVAQRLDIPIDRVDVVPLGPADAEGASPTEASIAQTRERLQLPDRFAFYPAQTFPHKNHLALVEAIAQLRTRGSDLPVVFSGTRTEHAATIDARAAELGVTDLVHWAGHVSTSELSDLYASARVVAIPTKFEAASAPIWEAMRAGVPVVSSDVTSLPAQVANAGLVVPVDDVSALARALLRAWSDETLRAQMIERGSARVRGFTYERAARHFAALYRRVLELPLQPGDVELLDGEVLL